MQTPRDVILNTVTFKGPDRFGFDFPEPYRSDFCWVAMSPSPDIRPRGHNVADEWGAVWGNIGVSAVGEVKQSPLESWDGFSTMHIPDIREPSRYADIRKGRAKAGGKFLIGFGVSLYERVHFMRGLENAWCDIHTDPEKLCEFIDVLVDMNLYAFEQYGKAGFDGVLIGDDWGLQDRLAVSPQKWRELWKPRYAKVFMKAHELGMRTFLHSCGYITDILDDLIDIGLDVVHMDQQENMGLNVLGKRFGGRLTFFCPVDIQTVMPRGNHDEIRAYCRHLVKAFATPQGGFIPRWYTDPRGVGHSEEAIKVMCEEFLKLSKEVYGN